MFQNISKVSIVLIIFGIIVISYPDIIAYLFGGLLVFIGFNVFFFGQKFGKNGKGDDSYVKFGDYKIYRGKKK